MPEVGRLGLNHQENIGLSQENEIRDRLVSSIYRRAAGIASLVVKQEREKGVDWDRRLDDVLTSPWTGYPAMLILLGIVFWVTILGANYPSRLLAGALFWLQNELLSVFIASGSPEWLYGFLILGVYRSLAWVVSVMLPPMAIFFPLFTLLEDLGYLPRVAFNLDHFFKCAGTHGKQALTMSMGFGCNAAGVVACRIIDSPRARLIATLTNNFVPCNGRFPLLITLSTLFAGAMGAPATIIGLILLGVTVTLAVSWLLSRTLLRGVPSSFTLELPPYRRPDIGRILVRSFLDRTVFVLMRAVSVAAPAGGLTWVLANLETAGNSLIGHSALWLDPLGRQLGLDGFILLAFILGLPANEIVLPILLMSYTAAGSMLEVDSLSTLRQLLISHGWTWVTATSMLLFSLLHFPCATTLWTIRKETGSWRWTILAALIPTAVAVVVTLSFAQLVRLF